MTTTELTIGQKVFKRYELRRILGRGGMGTVWLAEDRELGIHVALKFLPENLSADRVAVEELKREVRRAIGLAHPHIVKVHDLATDGNFVAISMEYIQGKTLSELRQAQPSGVLAPAHLLPWVKQLCGALDYAHLKARVVHRDLKPANIMVDSDNDVKILDFGIAASLGESATRVTNRGTSGTLSYMSPQQLLGNTPTASDDLYSLGATLYEMLTGKPPFFRGDLTHLILKENPPPLSERRETGADNVPLSWETTILKLLEKEPARRPQSGAETLGLLDDKSIQPQTPSAANHVISVSDEPTVRMPPKLQPTKANKTLASILALGIAGLLLGASGYYFGVAKPEQEHRQATEQLRANEAAAKETAEKQRLADRDAQLKIQQARAEAAAEQKHLDERARQEEAQRLALARGGIMVRTQPTGAIVHLGTLSEQKSPATLKDLKSGIYTLQLRAEGYDPYDGQVEIKGGEMGDVSIDLIRSKGLVVIESQPTGLSYEVRGETTRYGKTPANESLPTGKYQVVFSDPGRSPQLFSVETKRGQTTKVSAEFLPVQNTAETKPRQEANARPKTFPRYVPTATNGVYVRILEDGSRSVGRFQNGKFVPIYSR